MRRVYSGVAASKGLALGRARVREPHRLDVEESRVEQDQVEAERALEIGLVNHVTALEELDNFSLALADKIAKNSPVAIAHAIKVVNAGFRSNEAGYQAEIQAFGDCFSTADFREGTSAFLEKRKPDFPGK